MVNTTYNSTKDMIINLPPLKGKTKLNCFKNVSNYYDEMHIRRQSGKFQFEEDTFSKNVQSIGKKNHGVLLSMKFLQTKPQVKNMNNNYYDLYYTVIQNRNKKEFVDDQYDKNGYINDEGSFLLNHNVSIKPRETILR